MHRHVHDSGDLRSRLRSRQGGGIWLYDHVRAEFRRDIDLPESSRPEVTFRDPKPRPAPEPRFRMGPVARFLFVHGGMSVVFLVGLMLFGIVGWALGY